LGEEPRNSSREKSQATAIADLLPSNGVCPRGSARLEKFGEEVLRDPSFPELMIGASSLSAIQKWRENVFSRRRLDGRTRGT